MCSAESDALAQNGVGRLSCKQAMLVAVYGREPYQPDTSCSQHWIIAAGSSWAKIAHTWLDDCALMLYDCVLMA